MYTYGYLLSKLSLSPNMSFNKNRKLVTQAVGPTSIFSYQFDKTLGWRRDLNYDDK